MVFSKISISKIEFYTKDSSIINSVKAVINKKTWKYFVIPTTENISFLLNYAKLDDKDNLEKLLVAIQEPPMSLMQNIVYKSQDDKLELRDYQKDDLNILVNKHRAANFSEQRTGKTPTTLLTIKNLNLKSIIICPASLSLLSWQPQIQKWLGVDPIIMFKKVVNKKGLETYKTLSKVERLQTYREFFFTDNKNVLVVSKDTWKQDFDEVDLASALGRFVVVVDEAHILKAYRSKNKTTKQAKSILYLAKYAQHKYALSGTPSSNHPSDVFGILHYLDPKRFASWYDFIDYFWGFDYFNNPNPNFRDTIKGYSELETWLVNIVKAYAVMHKQKEVMQWLPEKIYEEVRIPMHSKQAQMYYNIMVFMEYKGELTQNILTQLHWLRQVSNYGDGQSNKIDWLVEYIKENPTEKLLILSNYSNGTIPYIVDKFKEIDFSFSVIVGDVPQIDREKIINKVQNDECKHLIANITCLKEGIQLDSIDTVVFLDRAFSPADNEQVEARFMPVIKDGLRDSPKKIIDLISISPVNIEAYKGTEIYNRLYNTLTDEKIIELINNKIDITQYLNKLGKNWDVESSD